jgi:hypothetical protein
MTKDTCIRKYLECKVSKNGGVPEYREFLQYSGIEKRQLSKLFGTSAYSKLQVAAGDSPNKLQMERTPFATIMRQYGDLVTDLGGVPAYPEWAQRGLKPTDSGLRGKPHNLKWSELPTAFVAWVTTNRISGFDTAIEIIAKAGLPGTKESKRSNVDFVHLIKDVREWVPARRRNSEAEYKIELRKHLESLGHDLNEEFGESKCDLLVRRRYAIELKKDPDLAEYDRLFGQLARHLQHQCSVIVLILEATRNDKYDNFTSLVDQYLNVDQNSVEVIKR